MKVVFLPDQNDCTCPLKGRLCIPEEGEGELTDRHQVLVGLQHDIFVQVLLCGAQPFPLLLGEVDSQIRKRHWGLKWKISQEARDSTCLEKTVDCPTQGQGMGYTVRIGVPRPKGQVC